MAGIKTAVLLGGGIESIPIIQRVRELDFRAVVVDGNPNAPGFAIADHCCVASCYHGDQAIRDLRIVGENYDGVLCAAVDAPIACAEVAAAFELLGLSMESARLSQDKLNQKWTLRTIGIAVPQSAAWDGDNDNLSAWADVVKPVDSRGGRGVTRLLPNVDLVWAYEQARSYSPTGRVMVEQWLDGPQLSTESIVKDGHVLFTAVGLRNYARLDEFAPYVIEDGFDEPYPDHAWYAGGKHNLDYDIDSIIESACRALGWYQSGVGTVKGDLVIHDGRVYVIELAARLSGGFFASHGHPLAYGVDFVGAAIKAALGYTLEEPKPYARGFVSQRYCFAHDSYVGKTVVNLPDSQPQTALFSSWNIHKGSVVRPVTSHPDRLGQSIGIGDTLDMARFRAEVSVSEMMKGLLVE